MVNAGILISVGVVVAGLVGLLIWWQIQRSRFRFTFRVWSKDLSTSRKVMARISVNAENKNKKEFTFKHNPSVLLMRDPQHWADGKAERWVLADESGEFQYLSPSETEAIDKKVYMKTRMHPVNRQLALEQFRNNQKRYEVSNKMAALTVFGAIILGIFIAIGIIYGVGTMTKYGKSISQNIATMREMQTSDNANREAIMEGQVALTENLGYIYAQLGGNVSVIRPVGGIKP